MFQQTARADVNNVVIGKIEFTQVAKRCDAVQVGSSTPSHPQHSDIVETASQVSVRQQMLASP